MKLGVCAGVAAVALGVSWTPVRASTAASQPNSSRASAEKRSAAPAPVKRKTAQTASRKTGQVQARRAAPPSVGQLAGLHATDDVLDLKSSVALVVDQETDEVIFSKNADAVLPIASITKLMTALVVADARLPLDEVVTVTQDDVAATASANMRSRLTPGTRMTRGDLLHLALMSSENRAAHVLGRTYPGGIDTFVAAMNAKASLLGMSDTRYVEPTGLSSDNRSSAQDLSRLVRAASEHPVIREYSTAPEAAIPIGRRMVQYHNTNGLVRNPQWDILLQKTGYISAAGRCVVMQAQLAGRQLIMVLLDSAGKYTRIADAERIRKWLLGSNALQRAGISPVLSAIDPQPR